MRLDLRLGARVGADEIVEAGRRADERHLATVWSSEAAHDPFLPIALLATTTTSVGLGTGIAVAFARSPFATAQAAWDLQRITGGRFVLGLGTQVQAHIERRYSQPWHGAVRQMRDYVACCRHIWSGWQTGSRAPYEGEIYRFTLSNPEFEPGPLPGAHAAVPIWLAGVGPGMARLVGEVADGFHVHAFHTEPYLRDVLLPAVAEGRRRGPLRDRPFEASSPVMAGVAHDEHERDVLREEFRRHVAFYGSTPAYRQVLESVGAGALQDELRQLTRAGRWDDLPSLVTDELLDRFVLVDEPERLGRALAARYGGILTQLALYRGGDRFMTDDDWQRLAGALAASLPAPTGGPAR